MSSSAKIVQLANGKRAIEWTSGERPAVNHWYLTKDSETDYWKIAKDYHDPKRKITYYKVVEYYNGDNLFCGKSLAMIREIMREYTYRMVI